MKNLGGKALLILVVVVGLGFLVFRFSENQHNATALERDASESAIIRVALTRAKPSAPECK